MPRPAPSRWRALVFFGAWSLGCLATVAAEAPTEAPKRLAPVVVTADPVPLVKLNLGWKLRVARFGAAAVTDGRYIYVIGGSNAADTPLTEIERLDPSTGQSESFAQLAIGRRGHRAIVHAGKIYVLGGYNALHWGETDFFEASVEVIDLTTRGVSRGPEMPIARANFGCAIAGGRVYVLGGARRRNQGIFNTNTVDVLDLGTGKWRPGVPMPTPRLCAATAVGDFIVVAGGSTGNRERAEVEAFALDDQQWRALPKLTRPMHVHSALFVDRALLLFGHRELISYDLKSKQSQPFRFDYKPAREPATVMLGNRLFICGGMERNIGTDDSMASFFSAAPKPAESVRREPDESPTAESAAISAVEDLDKLHVMLATTKDYIVLDEVQVFELRKTAR